MSKTVNQIEAECIAAGLPPIQTIFKNDFGEIEVYFSSSLTSDENKKFEDIYYDRDYKEKRAKEYPPLADLADAIYWQAQGDEGPMNAYVAKVQLVKDKYPPNGQGQQGQSSNNVK